MTPPCAGQEQHLRSCSAVHSVRSPGALPSQAETGVPLCVTPHFEVVTGSDREVRASQSSQARAGGRQQADRTDSAQQRQPGDEEGSSALLLLSEQSIICSWTLLSRVEAGRRREKVHRPAASQPARSPVPTPGVDPLVDIRHRKGKRADRINTSLLVNACSASSHFLLSCAAPSIRQAPTQAVPKPLSRLQEATRFRSARSSTQSY